jgi:hypothetical protein
MKRRFRESDLTDQEKLVMKSEQVLDKLRKENDIATLCTIIKDFGLLSRTEITDYTDEEIKNFNFYPLIETIADEGHDLSEYENNDADALYYKVQGNYRMLISLDETRRGREEILYYAEKIGKGKRGDTGDYLANKYDFMDLAKQLWEKGGVDLWEEFGNDPDELREGMERLFNRLLRENTKGKRFESIKRRRPRSF